MPSSSDRPPEPPDVSGPDPADASDPFGPEDGIHESSGVYESDDGIYDEDPEDTAAGAWRLSKLNMGLLCLSVVSLSAALYISPAGRSRVRGPDGGRQPDSPGKVRPAGLGRLRRQDRET